MNKEDLQAMSELLDTKLEPIKSQLNENTQILKSLEEASQMHKSDIDHLTHEVAAASGEINEIKKNISRIEVATAENWADVAKLKAVK
jgi:chromosome segregation ATPase